MLLNNNKQPQEIFIGEIGYHYNRLMVTQNIGMKLSTHTHYITAMTFNCFPWQPPTTYSFRQFSLKLLLHFSNSPTMCTWRLNFVTCVIHFIHDNSQQKCPQALFPINFSNMQTMQYIELKHGTHVCLSISLKPLTKIASGNFSYNYFFTSQSCTPYTMHEGETWYAHELQYFHNNQEQIIASGTFSHNYFFTSQTCKPCNAWK